MNKLANFFKEKSVLYLFIPFLILGFAFELIYGKSQGHLIINGVHNNFGDFFFKHVTHLGDGIIFPILIIVTLFLKFRWSLYLFAASLLTLLLMYLTKQLLFHGIPRPIAFFENLENLYLINSVKVHKSNSFPSGHTTTAFAIFTLLIVITKNNYLKFTFALLAIIAGFSRIYLSQHFLIDVLAGAILGVSIALISCLIIDKICYKYKISLDERISVKFSIK
jgi:membrane-associated phospholipid phosphatase